MNCVKWFKNNKLDVILVLALFLLAFGIRSAPSSDFPNIYGFDSFWASRMTKYMITQEQPGYPFAPFNDTTTDYPWGRINFGASEVGWWGMNALAYEVAGGSTTPGGFNYDLFGKIASWMVVIFGSLAIPVVYLLGKEAYSRTMGLASSLFLMGSTTHIFYSIFGHAENDALGLTLFFMCMYAFVLAVKRKNWKYLALAFASFTWLANVWQSYIVVSLLVAGTCVAYFAIAKTLGKFGYYKDTAEKTATRKWMIYSLLAVAPSALTTYLFNGTGMIIYAFSTLTLAALFCILLEVFSSKEDDFMKKVQSTVGTKVAAIAVAAVAIGFLVVGSQMITGPLNYVGIGGSTNTTAYLPYETRMQQTIAEQNPVAGNNFLERINNLSSSFGFSIWFALIAVLLGVAKLIIMPLSKKDFNYEWDLMAVAFIFLSMWTLTSKSVTTFFLSAAVVFGAGYFFHFIERIADVKQLKKYSGKIKAALLAFIMLSAFSGATIALNTADNFGYDIAPEWFQTFSFLNTVPQGSVVTAWWDYGHWMNYFNGDNIHTTLDNIQDRKDIIFTVASAFTHTTACTSDGTTITCDSTAEALETAEIESLSLLKPLKTDYILIDKEIAAGSTGGKFGALEHIANTNIGCIQEFGCNTGENGTVTCILGTATNAEGKTVTAGYSFTSDQWNSLTATTWPGAAVNMPVYDLEGGSMLGGLNTRYFGKTMNFSGKTLYGSALSCGNDFFNGGASASAPSLYAFEQRLFFNDPSLKHVTKVYDDGWNVVYKVNWAGIPDPLNYTIWTKQNSVLCTGQSKIICDRGYAA